MITDSESLQKKTERQKYFISDITISTWSYKIVQCDTFGMFLLKCLVADTLEEKKSLHDLLILVHNDVACAVRDILGIVKTTKNHTNATIKALFDTGAAGFNLYLSIFPIVQECQAYLYATLIELSAQVKQYFDLCVEQGIQCDTSSLNAECSEHINSILKQLELHLSNHVRRDGRDGGIENHLDSRCFRPFVHEYVTKQLSLELGMTTDGDIASLHSTLEDFVQKLQGKK